MRSAWSASRVWRAVASASEYTATVRMPRRRAVRKIRQAISPRLATRRLLIKAAPLFVALHAEHAEARRLLRGVAYRRQAKAQHAPGVTWVDDPIVPQPRRGIIGMPLALVLLADRALEGLLILLRPLPRAAFELIALDGRQHARRLLPAHDGNTRVRPLEQEARRIGAAAHGVVAGPIAAADDDGELGHVGAGDRGDKLGAVLGDAAGFGAPPDHEAGDVLQEQQRNLFARAQFDEVRALQRALREQHAVVGEYADPVAAQVRKPAHQRRAIKLLELIQFRSVREARDDLAYVIGLAQVRRHHPVQLLRRITRRRGRRGRRAIRARLQTSHDAPCDGERMGVVLGVVITHTRLAAVHLRATERFRVDVLAGGGLDQRWPAEEHAALVLHDDVLIGHRRDVGATCGTRAVHHRDLRNAERGEGRLVVEDAAEVVPVGEHLILGRQERPAALHQVDARQAVVARAFLRAQVLLNGQGIVGTALDRRIIRHHHALAATDAADTGQDAGAGNVPAVHPVRGQLGELEEGTAGVEQYPDALAGRQFAGRLVLVGGRLGAAFGDPAHLTAQLRGQGAHGPLVVAVVLRMHINPGDQTGHGVLATVAGLSDNHTITPGQRQAHEPTRLHRQRLRPGT